MTKVDYLLQCSEDEILNTWHQMGRITVYENTKIYTKDTVVRVFDETYHTGIDHTIDPTPDVQLRHKILYVLEDYVVDNKTIFDIDWSEMAIDDVNHMYVASQGIALPYFVVLPATWRGGSFIPNNNFVPFQNQEISIDDGGISIPDDELERILVDIGFPFLSFTDVEYARNQITRICIKAALQRYYSFRPQIEEEAFGNVSIGSEFDIPLPPYAFAAIPYYCVPGGFSPNGSGSPFAFYNEQTIFGGGISGGLGGGRFGKPIRYNKPVPGYAGIDENSALLDALAARQGYLNFFRREKYRKYYNKEEKCYKIKGFSTIGGLLNVKWFMWNPDWSIIPMDEVIVFARPMAKVEVLNAFAMLRSLCKTDIAGQLDATVLSNKAKEYEDELKTMLKTVGIHGSYAIMRGGG